ncbi:MAG: MMPL family transporter, partial [Candidatus Velamenicoccus archaeovorus]
MRLNPESMARASGRRPWWTIGAWVVVIVAMAMVSARFLGGVLTDEVKLTNRPESVKAQEVIDAQFGGRVVKDTEFLVVSSDTRPWGPQVAAFVTELKGQVEALGPEDVAGPVTTYADAVAMRSLLFTPDGHGMLLVLQLRGNPEPTIARIAQAVERAVPVMFQAQVLTPEQLAALAGEGAGSAPVQADPPEAYVLVSSDAAMTNNLQFLNAVQQIQVAVTRAGGRRLAAPPYSGYDAVQQADTLISPDRYTTLVAVPIVELSEDIVADLREVAGRADDGTFRVQVAGSAAVFADMMQIGEEDMRKSESIGLLVALLVLVVVFGSIVAAVLPLIMGLFAIAVALGLVALVGQIWGFNMFVENMVTMIGLAVGIDYSLFIVSRYREERKKGFEKLEAIRRSGATASRAVFFSGATVVLALLGMLIVPVSIFRSLAGGAILVTIAAIAASMTLLPAILSLLGDRVNWPRLSRRARLETSHDPQGGFWDRVTRSVMRRPVVYLVASVLVLGSLAGFYLQLHRGTTQNISALPPEFPSRQAFITLVNEFHLGGVSDPVQVVLTGDVTRPEVREAVKALQWELGQQETFSNRSEVAQSKDGRAMLVSAYFSGDTMNDAAFDGIRTLRTDL